MTEQELTTLLYQLHDIGVTGIKVRYDGGGDSGSIEWIGFTKQPCETPEDINDKIDDWENESNITNLDTAFYSQVEGFAYDILNNVEDWWNDEGGYGSFCFLVPSGKYIINNHIRITETEDYFHDGDLLNKTEE